MSSPCATAIGLTLQPDEEYLALLAPLFHDPAAVDYFEHSPETTWWSPADKDDGPPRLEPNGFHAHFLKLGAATAKPFVGHGVGLSLGSVNLGDGARRRQWLERLAKDQALFGFRWYTEHLGMTAPAGQALALPLPLLMDAASVQRVARRLRALHAVVPQVGIENTAQYFVLGEVLDEPRFLHRILKRAGGHLLLDLHNLHTMAENFGFSPVDYLDRTDLAQVIEIHLSGGSYSDGSWLPSGRRLRLDSHDSAVPEPVWNLLEAVLPRCPNLAGVTLERMEGTVSAADVPLLAEELRRLRTILSSHGRSAK